MKIKRFLVLVFDGRRNLIEVDLDRSLVNDIQQTEIEYLLSTKAGLSQVLNTLSLMDWLPFQLPTIYDAKEQFMVVFVSGVER